MKLKLIGAVRLLTAVAILGSVYWQVSDRIINNVFHPEEYWAYFTIDTSLLMSAVLLTGAALAWFKNNHAPHWFEIGRLGVVGAYVVVAVVYNALLRNDPPDARDVAAGYSWPTPPNEILHVWAPLIVTLEVILVTPALRVKFVEVFWAALYPVLWLTATIIRGNVDPQRWWPYWFINPDTGGVQSMLMYIVGITGILIVTTMVLLAIRKALEALTRRMVS